MLKLFGLAVPFGVDTDNTIVSGGLMRERIECGAFGQSVLDARDVLVTANHQLWFGGGAFVALTNAYSGLYFTAGIPETSVVLGLLGPIEGWRRGVSISFRKDSVVDYADYNRLTNRIMTIGQLLSVSLLVASDTKPAYADTWFSKLNADALNRMKQEDHEAKVRIFGSGYRTEMPRSFWDAPLQSTAAEAAIRAKYPERGRGQWYPVFPWGTTFFNRELSK